MDKFIKDIKKVNNVKLLDINAVILKLKILKSNSKN